MLDGAAEKIIESLTPPKNGADPGPWRFKVWVSILVLIGCFAFHMAADSGLLTVLRIERIVRADELAEKEEALVRWQTMLTTRLDAIEAKQDSALMLSLSQEICRIYHLRNEAPAGTNLRAQLDSSFEEKQTQYQNVDQFRRRFAAASDCSPPQ